MRFANNELSTVMGAISDAILAVDREGVPLFFNSKFELLFGLGPEAERMRNRAIRLPEIFDREEVLEAFQTALREHRNVEVQAIPVERDFMRRYFSVSVAPLTHALSQAEDETYGAVGVFHDVTELKLAEKMRIDFVANVSHELRTPLTSIKGYTDTLIQDVRDGRPPSDEFLQVISRNTDRLMSLIGDLLDLSSLESAGEGADVLHKAALRTEEITARVVNQLKPSFDAKQQTVGYRCDAPLVNADATRLEQVLVNLLDNAHKYAPAGGRVEVIWQQAEGAGDPHVDLRVKDNGPGIAFKHLPRLFERFYRVDKARSREQGGTGLGLAIVKHIMQKHGGTASVESRPGEGATFICRFPA